MLEIAKLLKQLTMLSKYGSDDQIEEILESTDLDDVVTELNQYPYKREPIYQELITQMIGFLNYLENETDISTPVTDDNYDRLSELYKTISSTDMVSGTNFIVADDSTVHHHKFPELRGSLAKAHYVYVDDVPRDDMRGSVEAFVYRVEETMTMFGFDVSNIGMSICCSPKYDGVSHVFEFSKGGTLERVLTRYNVEQNLGKDVSHVFRAMGDELTSFIQYPESFKNSSSYGVKVETYMTDTGFAQYTDIFKRVCNRRSAVNSIMNRHEENVPQDLLSCLSCRPFQIASIDYVQLTEAESRTWKYIGVINGHHNYLWIDPICKYQVGLDETSYVLDAISCSIDPIKDYAKQNGIPIDGIVITFLNDDIISTLGRKDDINRFQLAYKIPAGIEKTILKSVEFSIGPASGTITPIAHVEPVVINNATISVASLSNFDKLEKMHLHVGDEVLIKYDIIPKMFKDAFCKESNGPEIIRPTHCPICGGEIRGYRCIETNCPMKIPGKIYNYVRKLQIPKIGRSTVIDLCNKGILTEISDLYTLPLKQDEIVNLPGYGQSTFSGILTGIYSRLTIYPHELLGAIGIPGISLQTMKQICKYFKDMDILKLLDLTTADLQKVPGIGEIKAKNIVNGLTENNALLHKLLPRFTFLPYDSNITGERITFTLIRDAEFAKYLESLGHEVGPFTRKTTLVITPNDETMDSSTKVTARDLNIPMLTMSQAKKKFQYEGD